MKHSIDVLLLLLENGPMEKNQIYSALTKNTDPVNRRIEEMRELGLVAIYTKKDERRTVQMVELTDRGKRLSTTLHDAETIIQEA
jgi:DNA-binding MarR family transcriptional regulator